MFRPPVNWDRGEGQTVGSLQEVLEAVAREESALSEVPLAELRFEAEGLLHKGKLLRVNHETRRRLFEMVDAPASYCGKHSPEFQAALLSEHARFGLRSAAPGRLRSFGMNPTAVVRGDQLITIMPGELVNLPNADVLRAVRDALGREGEGLFVTRIVADSERFELDLASPAKATVVRTGDIVQAGISIIHRRYRDESTQVRSYLFRLVCQNGMVRRECPSRRGPRTRRMPASCPNGRELQTVQIRRLTKQTWESLRAQLDAFKATSECKAEVPMLLMQWVQRARISWNTIGERLLSAWRDNGAEETVYGAVNALTHVATHDTTIRASRARLLRSLAGLLAFSQVHICPRCFSVITDVVDEHGVYPGTGQESS